MVCTCTHVLPGYLIYLTPIMLHSSTYLIHQTVATLMDMLQSSNVTITTSQRTFETRDGIAGLNGDIFVSNYSCTSFMNIDGSTLYNYTRENVIHDLYVHVQCTHTCKTCTMFTVYPHSVIRPFSCSPILRILMPEYF